MIEYSRLRTVGKNSVAGQQDKGQYGSKWYKLNTYGYESKAEVVCADLNYILGVNDYVEYAETTVMQNGVPRIACVSDDFSKPGYTIITLEELARLKGLERLMESVEGETAAECLKKFADNAVIVTAKPSVAKYIWEMLWLDMIYFNIDRHINNIGFYFKDGKVDTLPFFDFGESLFSDLRIFVGVENMKYAKMYFDKWPVQPLHYTQKEMVVGLHENYKCPYDIKLVVDHIKDIDDIRIRNCLELTCGTIREVIGC